MYYYGGYVLFLYSEDDSVENYNVQCNSNVVPVPFWLQPISLFGCFYITELKDTSLSLPIGVLLAGNQIRLPVSTAFIPALPIDDQSLQ